MIYSIDEFRDKGEGHLIDVLHFRKCNYYGYFNNKFSRKRHVVRRASNSIINH